MLMDEGARKQMTQHFFPGFAADFYFLRRSRKCTQSKMQIYLTTFFTIPPLKSHRPVFLLVVFQWLKKTNFQEMNKTSTSWLDESVLLPRI